MTRKFDLEDRLIDYSSDVIKLAEGLPNTKAGNHIGGQMLRCGIAPALLYGEAQGAESRVDFIHKMKIALKELKETRVCLKLAQKNAMIEQIEGVFSENEELIGFFRRALKPRKKMKRLRNDCKKSERFGY